MKSLLKNDPESIGPFKLIARLGAGGMGIVYLATRGTQSVALKVLNSASLDSAQAKARFRKEVETLSQIKSEYVAKVVDSDVDDDYSWLAVEFVNGPDLKALVDDKGPLSEQEWLTLAFGLLTGIDAIHSQGLIHRDIKPGNVLIAESGPKIIDFGIAQDLDATSLTMTGSVAGSPAWLSPEQIDGANLTRATDLFSAGSVLHFAASGISPWGDQSTSATSVVFNNILTKDPDTSMLPELQKKLVDALLQKEPDSRPSALEAVSLLEQISGGVVRQAINNTISNSQPRRKKVTLSKSSSVLIGVASATALVVALFVVPSVSTVPSKPSFVCAETSFSQGDLTRSSLEALETAEFTNVLSRECAPFEELSGEFNFEFCVFRNRDLASAESSRHEIVRLGAKESFKEEIRFSQNAFGSFGCRSFVQMGVMSESESRSSTLGFSLTRPIPLFEILGSLKSGESRFELMSDGQSGTFITRFYAASKQDVEISLAVPKFSRLELKVKYKSGSLPEWASKEDYARNVWNISGLSATALVCVIGDYVSQLKSEGKKLRVESYRSGRWLSVASYNKARANYCDDSEMWSAEIMEQRALELFDLGTCNRVRTNWPETATYAASPTVFCFTLEE